MKPIRSSTENQMRNYPVSDISKALDHYYDVTDDFARDFWTWLDINWDQALMSLNKDPKTIGNFIVSDEAAVRVELLLSPHYRTLFKAYQIRHGGKE